MRAKLFTLSTNGLVLRMRQPITSCTSAIFHVSQFTISQWMIILMDHHFYHQPCICSHSHSYSPTCLSNDCMPWKYCCYSCICIWLCISHSWALNDPFTRKLPVTWWQRIHQVTQRPRMYRKIGVRFDSVTLMLWNAKVFSETSPPQAIVARDFIHL